MPRTTAGVFTLVPGYEAVTGQVIQTSQHNLPLEDIAAALTGSLPRNGAAPMLAPLKLLDGTAAAPALTFNSQTGTGIYRTTNGLGIAVGGVAVAEFGAAGLLASTPIGCGMDYWGTTAPPGWLFPFGQAISRTTYAALFAILGTTYGAGNGTTTFNLPDKRDRASFGKGNMGGTAANRITGQPGGWTGTTLGASGGAQTHSLTSDQNGPHAHSTSVALNDPGHQHFVPQGASNVYTGLAGGGATATQAGVNTTGSTTGISVSVTIDSSGSGSAHNNLPPGIVCNYIIFAGA